MKPTWELVKECEDSLDNIRSLLAHLASDLSKSLQEGGPANG